MKKNRALNSATSGQTGAEEASDQRVQEKLNTNPQVPQNPQVRNFRPELPDPEETNAWRVRSYEDNDWPASYEKSIPRGPHAGNVMTQGTMDHVLGTMGKGKAKESRKMATGG